MNLDELLGSLLDLVASVDPVTRTLLTGVGMMLETSILLGVVVPGDTLVLVSSTAIATPVEFVALLLAVILGALVGESIGFALGRFFGPRIRRSRLGRLLGERQWERAENYIDRRGGIGVFASRFLPVLHSLVPVVVGMSGMRYRRFLAWTVPACVVWTTAWVSFGAVAGQSYRDLADQLHGASFVFVAAIALFVLATWLLKRAIQLREGRHMLEPGDGDPNTMDPD